MYKICRTIVQQ